MKIGDENGGEDGLAVGVVEIEGSING